MNKEIEGEMGRALNPQFTSKNRGRLWMMTVKKSFAAECVFCMEATAKFVLDIVIDGVGNRWIDFL